MTRREIRDCSFQLIFEKLLRDDPIEELYELADEVEEITVNDDVKELVENVLNHAQELDGLIDKFSEKRSINRIAKINIAILRIALYEMLYDEKTPVNAAINEAVLLTQAYSYKEDTTFVNGILGAVAKTLPEKEAAANV